MSAAEEYKADKDVDARRDGASEDCRHVGERLPGDVWGVIVQLLPVADSMSLSSVCSWLRELVLASLPFVELVETPSVFPAARFTSLVDVWIGDGVDLGVVLPALRHCPRLRCLALASCCREPDKHDALVAHLPLLCHLESISFLGTNIDGHLGKALASCEALREVVLSMRFGVDRDDGRIDHVAEFLTELTPLSTLRSLSFAVRDAKDAMVLKAALGAWAELEELSVNVYPDSRGWRDLEVSIHGLATTIGSSCPLMRRLRLRAVNTAEMSQEDMDAIGRMSQLQELAVSGSWTAATLAPLRALKKLEKLTFSCFTVDEEAADELCAVLGELDCLTALSIWGAQLSVEALCRVLRSTAAVGSLIHVDVEMDVFFEVDAAEKEMLSATIAEAVLSSAAEEWSLSMPLCMLSFLRACDGRTPAATMSFLSLLGTQSSALVSEEHAELLLAWLRSSRSLIEVIIDATLASKVFVDAVVAAVRAEPLTPTVLTLFVAEELREAYDGVEDELQAAGLELL
eukprot:PLAT11680.3.p1 GENE.PLAT11680.3~~PLAT11680.3.p1  ORF type:complete len:516 (+),score=102.99 PLAT11680.3:267-1814(+)